MVSASIKTKLSYTKMMGIHKILIVDNALMRSMYFEYLQLKIKILDKIILLNKYLIARTLGLVAFTAPELLFFPIIALMWALLFFPSRSFFGEKFPHVILYLLFACLLTYYQLLRQKCQMVAHRGKNYVTIRHSTLVFGRQIQYKNFLKQVWLQIHKNHHKNVFSIVQSYVV
jgi:hypothetical protein